MRKAVVALALLLCAAAVAYWLWSPGEDAAADGTQPPSGASGPVVTVATVAPEKMNAILSQPVRAQSGAGTIRGQVMAKGVPVAGATVTATRAESDESLSELGCHCDNACGFKLLECGCGEASEQLKTLVAERRGEVVPIGRTVTGADGTFELTQLDPGDVALWADSTSLGTSLKQGVAVGSSKVELELGTGVALKGKVTIDGVPVPANAWVTAIHGEQSRFFDVLTLADGTFSIGPLPVGRYSLVAGSPGALAGHEHVRKDSPTEGLDISLYTPRSISGTVELDGRPAGGVRVTMNGNHRESEAVTSGDGFFKFTELRPGDHEVAAIKGTLRADAKVEIDTKGNPKPAVLQLVEGARFSGTVRSADGPVASARVKVFSLGLEAETKSGADGRFELNCFAGKGANLGVKADGFVEHRQNVDLVAGEETTVAIVLAAEATIAGRVTDEDGAPIAAADIGAMAPAGSEPQEPEEEYDTSAKTLWAKSDDAGMFVVKKLKAGDYRLVVSHREHVPAETSARAPASGVQVQLKSGLALNGEVVNEAGKPVIALVQIWFDDDRRPRTSNETNSNAEGKFRARGLVAGKQWIRASSKEGEVTQEIEISATREASIRLVLKAFLSISGTVVDTDGKPLGDINVMGRSSENSARAKSKEGTGAFELLELKAGDYTLGAYSQKHEPVAADAAPVKAGTKGVKLVMKKRIVARGRVIDTSGKPVTRFQVNFRPFEGENGAFEVPVGIAGDQKLRVVAPGYLEVTKSIRVDGKDLEVGDITIGGREVRVRAVAAATGQPLERADIWSSAAWESPGKAPAAFTSKDGWATLRGMPLSGAVIVANHPKYRPVTVPLGDNENERVVPMDPGATLAVTVLDPEGRPVRAKLTLVEASRPLSPYEQQTDKAGVLKVEGMPAGKWTVIAVGHSPKFGDSFRAQQTVTLPDSGEVPMTLKLATGPVTASLTVGLPAGYPAQTYALLLAPGAPAPTSVEQLRGLTPPPTVVESEGKPGSFVFAGINPGRQVAVIFVSQPDRRGPKFFSVPLDITAEPKQSFTFPAPAASALIDASSILE
jgi:protocatechuate 3,4-dioxygenase beta subunit